MADRFTFLDSKRFQIWATLGLLLAGSIAFLLFAIADKTQAPKPIDEMHFQVLDEAGVPIEHAETFVRRKQGEVTTEGTRWKRSTATLTLEGTDRGATILVVARGYRIRRLENVQAGKPIVLREGLRVRLRVSGDAPPVNPPLVGLFRVRPTPETARLLHLDEHARIDIDLADLMSVLFQNRPEARKLPVEKFGFAVSEADAASGVMLPTAGTYEVRWGLFDEGPGTWYTLEDGPKLVIDVPEEGEGMIFDVPITRSTWARTREGLRQRIEELRAAR